MRRTEKHRIRPSDPRYSQIDKLALKSKNLYNASLYATRQHFFATGKFKTWQTNRVELVANNNPDYRALPAKVAGETVRLVGQNYASFFALLEKKSVGGYEPKVKLPRYLPKNGRFVVGFPRDAISKKPVRKETSRGELWEHTISPRELNLKVYSRHERVDYIRIVPRGEEYELQVIYSTKELATKPDNGRYASIDVGLNNLAAVFYNTGDNSELWNGRPIKSINQYYNKEKARLQSKLLKKEGGEKQFSSKRLRALSAKRNRKIDWELHTISSRLVNQIVSKDVSKIVIGKNLQWKQDINLGRRNNQSFTQLPHARFIQMIIYKAEFLGIKVILTEESYSSKASFLDEDELPVYRDGVKSSVPFSGKRIRRGLYRSGSGVRLNADINGAGNIMRKVVPRKNIFFEGIEAVTIQPTRITVNNHR